MRALSGIKEMDGLASAQDSHFTLQETKGSKQASGTHPGVASRLYHMTFPSLLE